jgi:hypothetical protein
VERPAPGEAPKQKFDRVRLDVQQGSVARIQGAVQTRLPHVKVDQAATPLGIHGVYVGVMPLSGGRTRVLVVTSNSRWYSRTIEPAQADPDAEIATTVAELLAAIESGQVAPDGTEVARVGPDGEVTGGGAITGQQRRPDSGWRLGFGLGPEIALGVWPTDIGGVFTGGGGLLEFRARSPRGVLLLAGGRFLGNKGAGLGLMRARAHAIAGYSWRPKKNKMEIDLGGGGSFEMWWVRVDGTPAEPQRSEQRGAPPLVGALLRLAVARLFSVGRADVRVGGRLEVTGSRARSGHSCAGRGAARPRAARGSVSSGRRGGDARARLRGHVADPAAAQSSARASVSRGVLGLDARVEHATHAHVELAPEQVHHALELLPGHVRGQALAHVTEHRGACLLEPVEQRAAVHAVDLRERVG